MTLNRRAFGVATLAAWAGLGGTRPATAQAREVPIAVSSTSFVVGGLRIGEAAGLFEGQGIWPRITAMDSGNAAMAALIGGSVHFAVAGVPEVFAARARGQDVVILANLYRGLAGSLILGSKAAAGLGTASDAPVEQRLKALDGLSIAVPSATSALLGPVRAAAAAAGARPRFTYLAQPAMPAALESGAIAGMVASFPFAGVPLLHKTGILWINGPAGDLPAAFEPASSSCLITKGSTAAADRDLIGKLRTSLAAIATFVREHRADAQRALAAGYPQLGPEEIDLAFAQQWQNWTRPDLSEDDLRQEAKLLRESGNIPGLDSIAPGDLLLL